MRTRRKRAQRWGERNGSCDWGEEHAWGASGVILIGDAGLARNLDALLQPFKTKYWNGARLLALARRASMVTFPSYASVVPGPVSALSRAHGRGHGHDFSPALQGAG